MATSVDDWETLTVHTAYSGSCTNDGATTAAIVGNKDVLVLCTNSFGAAPYNVSVLSGVVGASRNSMLLSSEITSRNVRPEGIEFFAKGNTLVVGSMFDGNITSVPVSISGATYSKSDLSVLVKGSSQVFYIHVFKVQLCCCRQAVFYFATPWYYLISICCSDVQYYRTRNESF